ncbi:uncharacterized protein LOC121390612 [Gigantopelta aegis]|uniref:uncharacterized protein LOC121390612 n=1 Tax=Gigantopelta aegis TaxID=1735272 RepID=UPI001B88BC93|nr:uncharacterized protein LOC121390612 [Gigantopelta aegis]
MKTMWNIMLLNFILRTDSVQGNRACQQLPGTAGYPVINMCESNAAQNSDTFYLDAFSNSTTDPQCICVLQVQGAAEIGFQQNIISGDPCVSTLTLYSKMTKDHAFSCRTDSSAINITTNYTTMLLELKTSTLSQESAYCLQVSKKGGAVAAVAGGIVGAVFIVVAVVVVVIINKRKKATKKNQTTDDDGYYEIRDVNPNNADANTNNNVNPYNTDDNVGNTYEHLQHNTVQYVNTPSSVDGDHVYLHVNEPIQELPDDTHYPDPDY